MAAITLPCYSRYRAVCSPDTAVGLLLCVSVCVRITILEQMTYIFGIVVHRSLI